MSNDSQSSLLLFRHFCSREILAGSCSFHAVGLAQDRAPCEHSRVDAKVAMPKWDAHIDGWLRFINEARTAFAAGIDVSQGIGNHFH